MVSKNNVVPFRKAAVEYSDDKLIDGLRIEIANYVRSGGKIKTLSEHCGGHPTPVTISRILSGDTLSPRMTTVITIFLALGFTIKAVSLGR